MCVWAKKSYEFQESWTSTHTYTLTHSITWIHPHTRLRGMSLISHLLTQGVFWGSRGQWTPAYSCLEVTKRNWPTQTYTKRPLCDSYCLPNVFTYFPSCDFFSFVSSSEYSVKTLSQACMEGAKNELYDDIYHEAIAICHPQFVNQGCNFFTISGLKAKLQIMRRASLWQHQIYRAQENRCTHLYVIYIHMICNSFSLNHTFFILLSQYKNTYIYTCSDRRLYSNWWHPRTGFTIPLIGLDLSMSGFC